MLAALNAVRSLNQDVKECVGRWLGLVHTVMPANDVDVVETVRSAVDPRRLAHIDCTALNENACRDLEDAFQAGDIDGVCVDCLVYDDGNVQRLAAGVPLTRIVMDFTEMFRIPDLVRGSGSDADI